MSWKTDFDLNLHTLHLLSDEPFWSALSREMTKRADKTIKTAGVRLNSETAQFEMLYDPDFWMSLDVKDGDSDEFSRLKRKGDKTLLLMHEFYHCIFGHCTSRTPEGGMTKTWNIAQDLAINGELFKGENINKGKGSLYNIGVFPGKKDTIFADYPVGLTAEAYYKMLKEDSKYNPEDFDGPMDNHQNFGDVDAETQIVAEQRLKKAMSNAAQNAMGNGWGSISKSMQKEILSLLKSTINWKKVLRYFVKTSQRSSKKGSIMRVNRRHPYVFPGRKASRSANVAIAIDQSGSVSDELLNAFFSELNGLASVANFTVIPFDHKIDETKIFQWKKNQNIKTERVMCGGTNFDAPTDYVNQKGCFDGLIILTDMCAPAPKKCNVQRMWGTDERNAERPYFSTSERVMVIKTKDD